MSSRRTSEEKKAFEDKLEAFVLIQTGEFCINDLLNIYLDKAKDKIAHRAWQNTQVAMSRVFQKLRDSGRIEFVREEKGIGPIPKKMFKVKHELLVGNRSII